MPRRVVVIRGMTKRWCSSFIKIKELNFSLFDDAHIKLLALCYCRRLDNEIIEKCMHYVYAHKLLNSEIIEKCMHYVYAHKLGHNMLRLLAVRVWRFFLL